MKIETKEIHDFKVFWNIELKILSQMTIVTWEIYFSLEEQSTK